MNRGASLQSQLVAYQSLYRKYRPNGSPIWSASARDHRVAQRRPRRSCRARLPLLRAARHRQDHHRAHPRQGDELHQPRQPTATRAARARAASRSPTARRSTSSRSTPRRRAGVEEMRDLIERRRVPQRRRCATKVYILDEVHMLSDAASKPRCSRRSRSRPSTSCSCSPPPTRRRSLPTIRSRTQHYEFTLYTVDEILGHLTDVAAKEGVDASPEALAIIARAAAGSMRDSLSLLDQAIAHGALDVEQVSLLIGGSAVTGASRCSERDRRGRRGRARRRSASCSTPGTSRVASPKISSRPSRDAFLLASAKGKVRVDVPEDDMARLAALGEAPGTALLVRILETLGQAVVDMRGADAADPRLVLEIALGTPGATRRRAAAPGPGGARRPPRARRARHERRRPSVPRPAPPRDGSARAERLGTVPVGAEGRPRHESRAGGRSSRAAPDVTRARADAPPRLSTTPRPSRSTT